MEEQQITRLVELNDDIKKNLEEMDGLRTKTLENANEYAKRAWIIGSKLRFIKEEKLYLATHHLFDEYVAKEFNIKRRSANLWIQLNKEITEQPVAIMSLRRWQQLLPLEEEQRDEIIQKVEENPEISDKEFKSEIEQVSSPVRDIPNEKYKEYYNIEILGKDILERIKVLEEKLRDYQIFHESARKQPDFQEYIRKEVLITQRIDIIKNIGSLTVT